MEKREALESKAIVVHYGELGLKGANRPDFIRQLRNNLRQKLQAAGCSWAVRSIPGMLLVDVPEEADEAALARAGEAIGQVFGVAWHGPATVVPHGGFVGEQAAADWDRLTAAALVMARKREDPNASFAVRVRRGDKRLPFRSVDLERRLGGAILQETQWRRVDLTRPDVTFYVDVRERESLVLAQRLPGPGGLPVGCAGRVLTLLSGGIDSPAAAWLLAKRGCRVDFLHFSADEPNAEAIRNSKIWELARSLARWTLGARLWVAPYTFFDLALMRGRVDHELVLFRRFILRAAERLAGELGAEALATGDSLSQVASQTLSNLAAASEAARMPILRPLIAYDKEEIVRLARRIGTYEIAIRPYKDCCALISRHPKTRSRADKIAALEARLFPDYERLIEQTLQAAVRLDVPSEA